MKSVVFSVLSDTRWHVYPTSDMPDAVHDLEHRELPQIISPIEQCWLCQQGLCTQVVLDDALVIHGVFPN